MIKINSFLKSNDIFINNKKTYGLEIENIINNNQEVIKYYKKYLAKIKYYNEKITNSQYREIKKIECLKQQYSSIIDTFDSIVNNIYKIVLKDKNFVLFHLCRITKEEESSINTNKLFCLQNYY